MAHSIGNGHFLLENPGPELEFKTKKASDKFSETLHVIANEPSLAFFRIQEHVRKTLPQLVEEKHEVQDLQHDVQGACFDMEYAAKAVGNMEKSVTHFNSIQELLKNSMFMKQQLQYEQNRRSQEQNKPSMYRSSHGNRTTMMRTQTIDLSTASPNRPTSDLSHAEQSHANSGQEDSPRARSSSLSSRTWVGPASLLR